MKQYLILLAMLLVAVANYAEKPANYVEASQEAYRASAPLMLEGYFTGDTFSGQIVLFFVFLFFGFNTPTRIAMYVKFSSRLEDLVAVRLLYQVLLRLPVNR